jgi:hypothetical protein
MKSSTKQLKEDISNLIVDLQDIYYTFPREMVVQERQYFETYIKQIGYDIKYLDIELELFKETGFVEDYAEEDEDGGT